MTVSKKPVALVTGSGRGIGRSIALELVKEGYAVVINSRSANPAITDTGAYEVKSAVEKAGGSAAVAKGDISSASDRTAILKTVHDTFGRLDLLVNNAGIAPSVRNDILDASEESFDHLININLKGPYFLTQEAAKMMIEYKKEGIVSRARICFITSISVFASSINRGDYCISKAGLAMASQLFAHRLGDDDIPVIEIRPGVIATDMTAGVQEKYDALIASGIFMQKRWGQPEDVARATAAFARGDLDYSTGGVIDVSGGFQSIRL